MLDRVCAAGVNEVRSAMSEQYHRNEFFAGGTLPYVRMAHDGDPRRLQCVTSAGSSADMPIQAASLSHEPIAPQGGARTGGY